MEFQIPNVPAGTSKHPIALVVISANNLAASSAFYTKLFGWEVEKLSAELAGVAAPGGPTVALRSNIPTGFPGMVPYLGVTDVDTALAQVVATGGALERAPWTIPGVGTLARFKDASGTIYGLSNTLLSGTQASMPMPFGANPKPPDGAICSIEMYAKDGPAAGRFFGDHFGWGSVPTMPQYVAFDPGAGIGGVFQSHTPVLPAVAYIYATDVEKTISEIESAGGTRQGDPMRIPGAACFGYFTDPSGTVMGLIGV